ncbi:MAG: hypothetical protein AB1461_05770 [Thermodesulfobacteriota bacterium]
MADEHKPKPGIARKKMSPGGKTEKKQSGGNERRKNQNTGNNL